MRTLRVAAAVALVAVGGCSSASDEPAPTPTAAVPRGFEVPPGLTLTPGGTTLATGKPGSAVVGLADNAASAVTVTVTKVAKGSIEDFRFFSLDATAKASTPYYVSLTVRNEGPAGLGGATLPVFAHDDANTNLPANPIVGTFKPCRPSSLPASFLPDATAKLCLVYLVPKGRRLQTIDLQPGAAADAIRWKP